MSILKTKLSDLNEVVSTIISTSTVKIKQLNSTATIIAAMDIARLDHLAIIYLDYCLICLFKGDNHVHLINSVQFGSDLPPSSIQSTALESTYTKQANAIRPSPYTDHTLADQSRGQPRQVTPQTQASDTGSIDHHARYHSSSDRRVMIVAMPCDRW